VTQLHTHNPESGAPAALPPEGGSADWLALLAGSGWCEEFAAGLEKDWEDQPPRRRRPMPRAGSTPPRISLRLAGLRCAGAGGGGPGATAA
jgi:hypothetical protein